MKFKCMVCGQEMEYKKKHHADKVLKCECGEQYVYGLKARNEFYTNDERMVRRWREEGMPNIQVGKVFVYPASLCRRWFRGEDINLREVV